MKLNMICPAFFGSSGYANHSKGLCNALNKVAEVRLATQLPQGWETQTSDEELKMIKKEDSNDRINVIIDLPFNWIQYAIKEINIGFLVFEGDKIPLSWLDYIIDKRINMVFVPSLHVLQAIKNTGLSERYWDKVKIVPHGFDPKIFYPEKKKEEIFTFLINKGFRNHLDRGGMQHGLRAFIQEFKKGEARLVLKLNPAYALPPDLLVAYINQICQEEKKMANDIGQIIFNYDFMNQEGLRNLYGESDVLLSPSEAEAFSLPCIESMACGKPVITTNFGGQTDFVNESNGWLVSGDMHEVQHELLYEGISWKRPHISELRKSMRESLSNRELYATKAENALKDAQRFKWEESANKAVNHLREAVTDIP